MEATNKTQNNVTDHSGQAEKNEAPVPKTRPLMSLAHEVALVFTVCSGQIMSLAPLGQALAPLHIIAASFDSQSASQLSWYLSAYALTVGTFILIMGRLGDMFGHRKLFSIGFVWLSTWSLVAGFTVYTRSQIFFDVCRALQGLGGAVLLPNALAMLGTLYPPGKRKAVVFSLFGASAPTGFYLAALFSSLVSQLAWWPWAFWIMALVAASLFFCAFLFLPDDHLGTPNESKETRQEQRFDWLGAVTGVGGLVLFNVAWNQAPSQGWNQAYVIVLLVLGVLSLTTFFFVERKVEQPLVPVQILKGKSVLVLTCIMLGWGSFGIWLYYWFEFVEVIQGNTPLNAVAQHAAAIPAAYAAAGFVALVITRLRSSWIMMGAMLAFCAGNVITATTAVHQLYWKQLFWGNLVMPFGMDMSFPASTLLLSNLAPKEAQGMAASLVLTTVNYSIALGLGVAGTVEVHFNDGGKNVLGGYRSAQYCAVGLSGLGVIVAGYFVLSEYLYRLKAR